MDEQGRYVLVIRTGKSVLGLRAPMGMLQSIFSIDVEDWFNRSGTGFEPPPSDWDRLESRIEQNLRCLLELLAEGGGTATCFFVGYFAKRFPHLVREAAAAGHEIASHSYYHRLVYEMSPAKFYEDALAARKLLEDISGRPLRGFRAPAFSVTEQTPWFFDKLVEAGYQYDSSVFPAHHQSGGLSTDKLGPHGIATPTGGHIPATLGLTAFECRRSCDKESQVCTM